MKLLTTVSRSNETDFDQQGFHSEAVVGNLRVHSMVRSARRKESPDERKMFVFRIVEIALCAETTDNEVMLAFFAGLNVPFAPPDAVDSLHVPKSMMQMITCR